MDQLIIFLMIWIYPKVHNIKINIWLQFILFFKYKIVPWLFKSFLVKVAWNTNYNKTSTKIEERPVRQKFAFLEYFMKKNMF